MSATDYDYEGRAEIGGEPEAHLSLGVIGINRNTWIGHVPGASEDVPEGIVTVTLLEEPFVDWSALATFGVRPDGGVELRGKSVFRPSLL